LFSPVTNGWRVSSASCAATLRCLIVDDSSRFLDAARGLLERQGIRVVGVASTRSDSVSGRLRPHVITAMHSSADERALVRAAFVGFAPAYRSARRTAGGSHLRAVRLRHLLGMGPASSKARGPAGAIGRVGQWPLFVMPAYGPLAMLDLAPGRTPPKPSRRSAAGAVCPRPDPPQACTGIRRAQPAHTGARLLHAEESDAR
jgi:hypothetical protein